MTLDRVLIALQGPKAEAVGARLAPDCAAMRFMDLRENLTCRMATAGAIGRPWESRRTDARCGQTSYYLRSQKYSPANDPFVTPVPELDLGTSRLALAALLVFAGR